MQPSDPYTAGEFKLNFVVSDGGNLTDAEVTTTGATLATLGTKTNNSDGTATYSATLTRDPAIRGDITVTVSDKPDAFERLFWWNPHLE